MSFEPLRPRDRSYGQKSASPWIQVHGEAFFVKLWVFMWPSLLTSFRLHGKLKRVKNDGGMRFTRQLFSYMVWLPFRRIGQRGIILRRGCRSVLHAVPFFGSDSGAVSGLFRIPTETAAKALHR